MVRIPSYAAYLLYNLRPRKHHRDVRILDVEENRGRRSIDRILIFLTESGLFYSCYWVSASPNFLVMGSNPTQCSHHLAHDSRFYFLLQLKRILFAQWLVHNVLHSRPDVL